MRVTWSRLMDPLRKLTRSVTPLRSRRKTWRPTWSTSRSPWTPNTTNTSSEREDQPSTASNRYQVYSCSHNCRCLKHLEDDKSTIAWHYNDRFKTLIFYWCLKKLSITFKLLTAVFNVDNVFSFQGGDVQINIPDVDKGNAVIRIEGNKSGVQAAHAVSKYGTLLRMPS